jgi:predicted transposase YbfD/YdcC
MVYTDFFSDITDLRVKGRTTHLLGDILLLSLCAVICGADDFEDIENYGKEKESFLKTFMALPGGIPSHDTIDRVFRRICPKELGNCLLRHSKGILDYLDKYHVGIDGKVLRATATSGQKKSGLCIVSAWASEQGLCLGQLRMDSKSNEKTAIPELLRELDLERAIVSIDAIACNGPVAETIVGKGGDYILALKSNQKTLYQQAQSEFERQRPGLQPDIWEDFGSGRIEKRTAFVLDNLAFVDEASKWQGLESIFVVEALRELPDGRKQEQTRYYISSLSLSAAQANKAVRSHWSIENNLHWQLDVSFNEDRSRIIKDNAPENMACLRKIALQMITPLKGKQSIKSCRKIAGWNDGFLLEILKNIKV